MQIFLLKFNKFHFHGNEICMILFFLGFNKNKMPPKGTKLSSAKKREMKAKREITIAARSESKKREIARKRASAVRKMKEKAGARTSSAKAAISAKARMTRCHNTCVANDGYLRKPKSESKRRKMSSSQRTAAIGRLAPWQAFLADWRVTHPDVKGREVMSLASVDYKKAKANGTV